MSWDVLFRIRQYLKGSLWFFPLIGAILSPLAGVIVHQADGAAALITRKPSGATAERPVAPRRGSPPGLAAQADLI